MKWNLKELRELVKNAYGREQTAKLEPCLESIIDRQNYLEYHFNEAKLAVKEVMYCSTESSSILKAIFEEAHTAQNDKRNSSKLKMEANLISCVQSLHSIPDILSHVISYSVGIEPSLEEHRIKPENILKLIKNETKLSSLTELFRSLIKHEDYNHLSSLVNHSKHKSIIKPVYMLHLTKEESGRQEVEFSGFWKKGKLLPSKPAFEFINTEFERQAKLIIEIGNELNFTLNAKKGSFNCD